MRRCEKIRGMRKWWVRSMSRGQKNSLAKMRRWFPCGPRWNQLRLSPCENPYILGRRNTWWHRSLCGRQVNCLGSSPCPADFGGTNFPVPWEAGKVISSPTRIFSHVLTIQEGRKIQFKQGRWTHGWPGAGMINGSAFVKPR